MTLLDKHKSMVDGDFGAGEHVRCETEIAEAVPRFVVDAEKAKQAPKIDTRQLELLEGRIVTTITLINTAGKRPSDEPATSSSPPEGLHGSSQRLPQRLERLPRRLEHSP